jgi:UDP-galactopyranose mutase
MNKSENLFYSFWQGGYEGADHINSCAHPLDMNASNQHRTHVREDYLRLQPFGIRTIRESIGWRMAEPTPNHYDFSFLEPVIEASQELDLQILWTLCHYGWPRDIDIFSPEFVERYARYAAAAAEFLAPFSRSEPIYTPINEISFLAYATCETTLIYPYGPHLRSRSVEFKRQLVRAAIAGMEAIWKVDPRARFLHVDPLIHVIAPPSRPDLVETAEIVRLSQYQAWDMLSGSIEPELGGASKYLDIIGVNYYHSNQWEWETFNTLFWHLQDPRRRRFKDMLLEINERYGRGRPLVIAETSHVGSGRGEWIADITEEIIQAAHEGLTLQGICLYPILDRHGWENLDHWHRSGMWDVHPDAKGNLVRVMDKPYAKSLVEAQWKLAKTPYYQAFQPHQDQHIFYQNL